MPLGLCGLHSIMSAAARPPKISSLRQETNRVGEGISRKGNTLKFRQFWNAMRLPATTSSEQLDIIILARLRRKRHPLKNRYVRKTVEIKSFRKAHLSAGDKTFAGAKNHFKSQGPMNGSRDSVAAGLFIALAGVFA